MNNYAISEQCVRDCPRYLKEEQGKAFAYRIQNCTEQTAERTNKTSGKEVEYAVD